VTLREPNFFLVGASRAGTTSLWRYLVEHPDIYMPQRTLAEKEPSFFCEVTPGWATAYRDRTRYLALFEAAGSRRAVGEASTPYLMAPEVPARIRAAYPDAKIIIVLRHPVERAFSLYRYMCLIGGEWVPTFERALALERSRMSDPAIMQSTSLWYGMFQYFHSGLYSDQIARYFDAFPREQIGIVLFDDLDTDSLRTTQSIYRFLGVDPAFEPSTTRFNESRFPFSVRLQYLIARDMNRSVEGRIGRVRGRLFVVNGRLGRLRTRGLEPRTRHRLLDAYRDDIRRTAALIGRPLDHWLNGNGSTV
jgi:hypothetical protein